MTEANPLSQVIPLADLIREIPGLQVWGDPRTPVAAVVSDSRDCSASALFVAIPGHQHDGTQFVADAVARGAGSVLVRELVSTDVVQVLAQHPREYLAPLAAAFHGHPSRRMRVVGVTGTAGKTTTSRLVDHVLSTAGRRTGRIDSLGATIGAVSLAVGGRLTTPQADDVQRLLHHMVSSGVQDAVIEASSVGLAMHRLDAVDFRAAVVTNITVEHLEDHLSVQAYHAAKALLVERTVDAGGPVVVNADDAGCRALRRRVIGADWWTFGIDDPSADVFAQDLTVHDATSRFMLRTPVGCHEVVLPLPARFNVSNALAAAALGCALEVGLEPIVTALSTAQHVPGRMTSIDEGQSFSVYIDYAHTIAAVRAVLDHVRIHHRSGRLIAVMGSGLRADHWKRPQIVEALIAGCDLVVFTASDAVWGTPEQVLTALSDAARSLEAVPGDDFVTIANRQEAIEFAIGEAAAGDTVLVLGKGHEPHIIVDGRRQPWSEEQVVRVAVRRRLR